MGEELRSEAWCVVTGVCGSSVVCRLLEHAAVEGSMEALVDAALVGNANQLCCHKYGHGVAMSILSNGIARHRRMIMAVLVGDVQRFARHRYTSSVMVEA